MSVVNVRLIKVCRMKVLSPVYHLPMYDLMKIYVSMLFFFVHILPYITSLSSSYCLFLYMYDLMKIYVSMLLFLVIYDLMIKSSLIHLYRYGSINVCLSNPLSRVHVRSYDYLPIWQQATVLHIYVGFDEDIYMCVSKLHVPVSNLFHRSCLPIATFMFEWNTKLLW